MKGAAGNIIVFIKRENLSLVGVSVICRKIEDFFCVPYKNRTENCENIGVVFGQRSQLWWSLPLIESFKLLRDLYMVPQKEYEEMIELYRSLVDIEPILHKPVRQMSLGQRTLSDILAAFLHNPAIVFLDEPTIGLDVSMKAKIRELILGLNKEKNTTVILTTHDMEDMLALCSRVMVLGHGRLLYDGALDALLKRYDTVHTLRVVYEDAPDAFDTLLKYIIEQDKCLEINTSGYATTGDTLAHSTIVKRYIELGGEQFTFGSDSHNVDRNYADIERAKDAVRAMGGKYQASFCQRKKTLFRI